MTRDVEERTPEQIAAAERKRLSAIAAVVGGVVPETCQDAIGPDHKPELIMASGKPCPIVCDQTNEIWPSLTALARQLDLAVQTVHRAVNHGTEINGMTYRLAAEPGQAERAAARKPVSKPVRERKAPAASTTTIATVPEEGPQPQASALGPREPSTSSTTYTSSTPASPAERAEATAPAPASVQIMAIRVKSDDPAALAPAIAQLIASFFEGGDR